MSDIPVNLLSALSDSYRIERELGQGGMATVYLAQDLKHERKVAVKVLREDLAASLGGFGSAKVVYRRSPSSSDPIPEQAFWRDSRSIVFISHDADGDASFWTVPVSGGRPRLVARLDRAHPSYRSDFATDGKRLFFAVQDRQSDVSLVELKHP